MSHLHLKNANKKQARRAKTSPSIDLPSVSPSPSPSAKQKEHSYVNVALSPKDGSKPNNKTRRVLPMADSGSRALSSSVDSIQGKAEETDRYNPLKLNAGSAMLGKRARRVHQRANRTDSESSSTSGVSDNLESKTREKDHYNRLKINMKQTPQNKKALQGLKILYKDRPTQVQGLHPASASQLHLKRKQRVTDGSLNVTPSRTRSTESKLQGKYRDESHTNKIHGVSEKPPTSPSFNWSIGTTARSYSMGDMTEIPELIDGPSAEGYISERARSHSLSESYSTKSPNSASKQSSKGSPRHAAKDTSDPYVMFDPVFSNKSHRRSDASDRQHSNHRSYSDGHRKKDSEDRGSPRRKPDSHKDQLTRPNDHHLVPSGASGPGSCTPSRCKHEVCSSTSTCICRNIPFVEPVAIITCNSDGGEYKSEEHGFQVSVPKGAIKKRTSVEIQIGVTLHGPFDFPEGKRPISPIVWICSNPETKFRKPVEVTLPHYLNTSGRGNGHDSRKEYGFTFLKALHKSSVVSVQGRRYQFHSTDGEEWFWSNENHGTLLTKHFCFVCIAANTSSDVTTHATYCLVAVIPKPIEQPTWKIHFCVTYLLRTCIQMVQRQFGEDVELLPPRKFRFADRGQQARIEIQFQRNIPDSGWILALESNNKIHAAEVDIWAHQEAQQDMMESVRTYPPRFTVRVHGEEATAAAVAHTSFMGASEELSMEVVLPVRTKSIGSTAGILPSRDSAVVPHPQLHISRGLRHCETCVCCDSDDSGNYDHLPSLEELDQTHAQLTYHNGRIDIPTDEDLHNVANEVAVRLKEEWVVLQSYLEIPDHIMLDVLHQRTLWQQVFRMLKEWRSHSKDCSKANLAECLRNADHRLSAVAKMLTTTQIQHADHKKSPRRQLFAQGSPITDGTPYSL